MYTLDRFIRENDTKHEVKDAMIRCLTENMTKEIAIDTIAEELSDALDEFVWDDGSNVENAFRDTIKDVLTAYFDRSMPSHNRLTVPVRSGFLTASASTDPEYPGIDIEFTPDAAHKERYENGVSNPRVLIEQPKEDVRLRAILWNDHEKEDPTFTIPLTGAGRHVLSEENLPDFIGQIVDLFEDYLDGEGIILENADREQAIEDGEDPECLAIIFGDSYDTIGDRVSDLVNAFDLKKKPVRDAETMGLIEEEIFKGFCQVLSDGGCDRKIHPFEASGLKDQIRSTFVHWDLY